MHSHRSAADMAIAAPHALGGYCAQCGSGLPGGARFCNQCGAPVVAPALAAAPPPPHTAAAAGRSPAAVAALDMHGPAERSLHYLALGAVGAVGFMLCAIVLSILSSAAHTLPALLVSMVMAMLPVPLYATLIASLDRHGREPGWLLVSAFFWGAVVAVIFAYFLNSWIGQVFAALLGREWANLIGPSLVAPVVEETSKGAALLVLFLFFRYCFNDVVDGIVYGALIGLGFAMTENMLYFSRAYVHGGFGAVSVLFFVRAILGGFGHSLYTGTTGAGLGLAEETTNPVVRRIAPVAGYCGAMFLHFLWNTVNGVALPQVPALVELFVILPFMTLLLSVPGLITLLAITYFGWRRETRVIAEQLKSEVDRGAVRPAEYAVLTNDGARARHVWRALFRDGPVAWYVLRQFYNTAIGLAFLKWHEAKGERLPGYLRGHSEETYRGHLIVLRARLAALGVPTE